MSSFFYNASKFIESIIIGFGEKERYVDCTSSFPQLEQILCYDSIVMTTDSIGVRITKDKKPCFGVYLSDTDMIDKLKIDLIAKNDVIYIKTKLQNVNGNRNGYISIAFPNIEQFEVGSESGDIILDYAIVKKLAVNTKSGDIILNGVDVDNATIGNINGDVICKCDKSSYHFSVTTINGEFVQEGIHNNRTATKKITINSRNGDVVLNRIVDK
jgi:hypothetical protein